MTLHNMRPGIATRDLLNVRLADAKHLSNSLARYASSAQPPYLSHIAFSQFCIAMLLTFWGALGVLLEWSAVLCRHIGHVVIMSSQKQVIGVDTCGGVTRMQYPKSIGNIAIVDKPRSAVRAHYLTLVHELAVAIRWIGLLPQPAPIGLIDLVPEAGLLCGIMGHVGTPLKYRPCPRLFQQRGDFVLSAL